MKLIRIILISFCMVLLYSGRSYASEMELSARLEGVSRRTKELSCEIERVEQGLGGVQASVTEMQTRRHERLFVYGLFDKDNPFLSQYAAIGITEDNRDRLARSLVNAAYHGNADGVASLIQLGVDVNGFTPIANVGTSQSSTADNSSGEMITPLQAVAEGWGLTPNELMSKPGSHCKVIKNLLKAGSLVPSDDEMQRNNWPQEAMEFVKKYERYSVAHPHNICYSEKVLEEKGGLPKTLSRLTMQMIYGDTISHPEVRNRIDAANFCEEVGGLE